MSPAPVVLVMAKSPVPGQVKTRLGAEVGMTTAAALASAALLDTLDTCEQSFERCYLALAGEPSPELSARLRGWTTFPQQGKGLGSRLRHAHHAAAAHADASVVQIGMDTPHIGPADFAAVNAALTTHDAVLGPAEDGGWWVLAVRDPRHAGVLGEVQMSTERTCADTHHALVDAGAVVSQVHELRDVDTVADADAVASRAPHLRFSRAWSSVRASR